MSADNQCTVTVNHGRLELRCRKGLTLFAALRVNRVFLPTGCGARGKCGQCRFRVLSGEGNPVTESEREMLSEEDLRAGYRLGCQFRLSDDVEIEMPESVLAARQFAAVVDSITPLTHDIRRFGFKLAPGETAPHIAGQYFNLMMKIPEAKVQAIRCFSFATPSTVVDRIDAIIRLNPKGLLTPHLFSQCRPGDETTLFAPYGDFHLLDTGAPAVWVAGGSGLSPFIGMLEDMVHAGRQDKPVHLFFGAVNPDDLYYLEHLKEISRQCPWFRFTPALSGGKTCDDCRDYGLITDVVAKHIDDASSMEGYLCGSPGMIGACIDVLLSKGMSRNNIFFDRF